MPIPQLKYKKDQSWRTDKKKYYLNRKKKTVRRPKKRRGFSMPGSVFSFINFPKNLKRNIILVLLLIGFIVASSGIIYVAILSRGLPNPDGLIERDIAQSTKIYDRSGEEILYEIHGEQKRTLVNLNDIPEYIKWAAIAIEDKDFYKHGGISIWGILRGVVWQKIRGRSVQGGSTLTQQFVKNAILTPERTIKRKLKEWILAYRIEKKYTKDEILQMYLNEIPYGSTAYGIEAASLRYFGKSAKDINLAEAAVLAALPQAPSKYSPYGPNRELLVGRQQYVLNLMTEQGYITEEEKENAAAFELEFKGPETNIKAPHFVMYIKEILSERYGEKLIEQGGLKIHTTLDLYKQEIAEEVIAEQAEETFESWNASNAALVSIDPKTGEILAMVGSRDYFNDEIDGQVNITTSKRQPGSSLKPLVYAAAFLKGYTPNTILYDVVTNFTIEGSAEDDYEPHNYDSREHGPVTIRKALAGSLNIPAVKALYLAGVNSVIDLAREFGYTTLTDPDRYGLSLVLGGGEVKLLEHTNAFGAFAREGVVHPLVAILKIEDRDGKILEEYEKPEEKKVIDPKVARLINDVLSDNNARAYAFGESNWLTLGSRPVAAKTGTTNDYRDAWTIGYTPSIVTGVWVGNNDNSEMKRGAAGGVVAAPIWHDYMKKVLGDTPIEEFRKPEIKTTGVPMLDGEAGSAISIKIDKITGLLASEYTPEHLIEEKVFFEPHCILYYVNKDKPLSGQPENPEKDPQFSLWENRVLKWAEKELASSTEAGAQISSSTAPKEYDTLHIPENIPELKITAPTKNQVITSPLLVSRIIAKAKRGISRVEYYINDNLLFVNTSYPYNMEKRVDFLNNGFHNLKIRVCDDADNCISDEVEFNLILDNNEKKETISFSLTGPGSGLAVSNIDFPLNIEFALNAPEQAAKIDVFYTHDSGEPQLITTLEPIEKNIVSASWSDVPVSGGYKLFGEAITWSNKKIRSNETIIIVNNISPVEEEEN